MPSNTPTIAHLEAMYVEKLIGITFQYYDEHVIDDDQFSYNIAKFETYLFRFMEIY